MSDIPLSVETGSGSPWRTAVTAVALLAALVGSLAATWTGFWAVLSFEPTSDSNYKAWVNTPLLTLGFLSLVLSLLTLLQLAFLHNRRPVLSRRAAVAALVTVPVLLGVALLERHARSHPIPEERSIVAAFPMPASYGRGAIATQLPAPGSGFPYLGLVDPPTSTRTWITRTSGLAACRDLIVALRSWPGAQLNTPASQIYTDSTSLCEFSGDSPQGWEISGEVDTRGHDAFAIPGTSSKAGQNIPTGVAVITLMVQVPGQ